jgi:hypothetical protein
VLEVNHEIAFDKFSEVEQLVDLCTLRNGTRVERRSTLALSAEDFGLGNKDKSMRRLWSELKLGGRGGVPRRKRGWMDLNFGFSSRISRMRCSSPSLVTTKTTP